PQLQSIQVMVSADHGAADSWAGPFTALPTDPGTFYLHGKPAALPGGGFAMAFGEVPNDYLYGPGRVGVAFSDDGRAWHVRYVADVPEGFESVWPVQAAADAAGALHVAWNARTGDTMTVFHSATRDRGASWSQPVAVRANGTNALPWVAARGDGEVAVGWYGGDATGDPSKADDNATWFAYLGESRDGGATWSVGKVRDEPVKEGPFCPLGARCPADRELLDYVSLVHGPDGRVNYAFAHSEAEGQGATARVLYAGTVPLDGATAS
ncbi:MAG TPA: hypothetical protein VGR28_02930, partial [Candidatus Thermoplasmatota archaeon]|nr:hypothetical protein [Candidatus Thermoplasmatota archaeon]